MAKQQGTLLLQQQQQWMRGWGHHTARWGLPGMVASQVRLHWKPSLGNWDSPWKQQQWLQQQSLGQQQG
jgi:hypothetical protein